MLSYRHGFHAGNHGDVLKHTVLTLLIEALKKKEAPFVCLETHAGAGRYDLGSAQAEKTGEYREGIAPLWAVRGQAPAALHPYLDAVAVLNPDERLRHYPGSPQVSRRLLRPQDRLVLMELHSSEYPLLKQAFAGDRQVSVHHRDGYEGLRALLPPKEKRGLVLMDPSYEVKSEYAQVVQALVAAHAQWAGGIYAVWYPLLASAAAEEMKAALAASGLRKILLAELWVRSPGVGMYGSGMLVLNPPWQLDTTLAELLPWLAHALAGQAARHRLEWLVPE